DAISDHGLAGLPHAAAGLGTVEERRVPAASKAVEIERNRFHPAVVTHFVGRRDAVAEAELAEAAAARDIGPLRPCRLLHEAAVEGEVEHAVTHRRGARG